MDEFDSCQPLIKLGGTGCRLFLKREDIRAIRQFMNDFIHLVARRELVWGNTKCNKRPIRKVAPLQTISYSGEKRRTKLINFIKRGIVQCANFS